MQVKHAIPEVVIGDLVDFFYVIANLSEALLPCAILRGIASSRTLLAKTCGVYDNPDSYLGDDTNLLN